MKHRKPALLLCALGIFLSWFLPTIVRAIHDAHGMATAHEFHTYQLIDQERLETVKAEFGMPNYSVEQRVRAVGGVHFYLPIVSVILGAVFLAIGALVWMADPAYAVAQTNSAPEADEEGEPADARESPS